MVVLLLVAPTGASASGGVIHEYLDPTPGTKYRCHIFFNPGTFVVTDSSNASTLDYLIVAGGGGGAGDNGGGGGGGGVYTGSTILLTELIQSRLELAVKELGQEHKILLELMGHLVHSQILVDQQQELPVVVVEQVHTQVVHQEVDCI